MIRRQISYIIFWTLVKSAKTGLSNIQFKISWNMRRETTLLYYYLLSPFVYVKRTFDRILYFNILLLTVFYSQDLRRRRTQLSRETFGQPFRSFVRSFVARYRIRNLFSRLCSWFLPHTPPSRIFRNCYICCI